MEKANFKQKEKGTLISLPAVNSIFHNWGAQAIVGEGPMLLSAHA